ncbi:MAG: type 1 glutamine amidotransferase domain-containing protein [Chroococcidiopsidaceae cyanobacterium CP_BM_ER_R8_30]|nr:type 1 glutamine amidotransferase domain-containing protein [Chroococcidiopsidaceae cyanobacterium CP_BM_ER_R8_30]
MSAKINILNPDKPKKVLLVASNPTISQQTGWRIGVWASEFTHPYYEFTEHGYQIEIVSPDGGKLEIDSFSDPRDQSGYSADDLISLGFLSSPKHTALIENTKSIDGVNVADYDAIFVCGGQGPMYTFIDNEKLHTLFAKFYEAGKIAAAICHGTCILLKTKLSNGQLLVEGKTWTGFANSEEEYADSFVGKRIQPFWIEAEAKQIPKTNFITGGCFQPFAIRDNRLITGQQQYSGAAAARLVIEALGV